MTSKDTTQIPWVQSIIRIYLSTSCSEQNICLSSISPFSQIRFFKKKKIIKSSSFTLINWVGQQQATTTMCIVFGQSMQLCETNSTFGGNDQVKPLILIPLSDISNDTSSDQNFLNNKPQYLIFPSLRKRKLKKKNSSKRLVTSQQGSLPPKTAYFSPHPCKLQELKIQRIKRKKCLTWSWHHLDGGADMQDLEEDLPFGDELVESPLECVLTVPAPVHRNRHRAHARSLHFQLILPGAARLLDLHLPHPLPRFLIPPLN